MKQFLSCDWGTSAFRLRLVETEDLIVIAEQSSLQGIAGMYQLWVASGEERVSFYLNIIGVHIKAIEKTLDLSLDAVPLIISGMASSSLGMMELPYATLPFPINGIGLSTYIIPFTNSFKHDTIIISGAKTEDDVMRGEETKMVGAASRLASATDAVFIFPGTHPKHITAVNGSVTGFKTYMTGEFFELLSNKSILSFSVEEGGGFLQPENKQSFQSGVRQSCLHNILHNAFLVRTNQLFGKLTKQQNFYFLSGLLIGTELNELASKNAVQLAVVGNGNILPYYLEALQELGFKIPNVIDSDNALIKGQLLIYQNLVIAAV